jgi:hypothetical protein
LVKNIRQRNSRPFREDTEVVDEDRRVIRNFSPVNLSNMPSDFVIAYAYKTISKCLYVTCTSEGQMLDSLKMVLVLLLCVTMSNTIVDATIGYNSEIFSVEATKSQQNVTSSNLSSSSMQVASTYPFPWMPSPASDNEVDSAPGTILSPVNDTSNKWTIVSGNWQPTANGVQAGADYTKNPPGIVVRPIQFTSQNLDISTSFTINSLPPPPPAPVSYIAIVYSWIDRSNYKYSGIAITENKTYVHHTTVRDGEEFVDPPWPGTRVDLEINPGDLVRMILSLRENSQVLNVNGIEVRKDSVGNNASGYAGLLYSRVGDVLFHQFDVRQIRD